MNGKPTWDEKYYKEIAKAVKKVAEKHNIEGIDWGYDMWKWDMAHFQMTGQKPYYDYRNLA